jgi:hypothetical protein
MELLVLFSVSLLAIGGCLTVMIARLSKTAADSSVSLEWLDDFSLEKYSVMDRLLDESDFAFLSAQPGYQPSIARRLREERRGIFREYLRQLNRDFNNLVALVQLMVVYGQQDQSALASALWRQRIMFAKSIMLIELRMTLAPLGVPVTGVQGLLTSLGSLQAQAFSLVPSELVGSGSAA